MGMNHPNQEAAMQQRLLQQQQAMLQQQQHILGLKSPGAEYIKMNLANMSPEQQQYLQRKGKDTVTDFFRT
ncbi:hypothetical protein N7523_010673 [Penicillium sp. IBT 18751x]|nr:hypothetical protein N7523_010673 [Penicillium sp. IBT 18751x]